MRLIMDLLLKEIHQVLLIVELPIMNFHRNTIRQNVQIAGFSTSSDTPLSNHANQSNFINAKDYHVLYWSSHGNSTPALNVINGPYFESYTTAYNNWRNTGNTLMASTLISFPFLNSNAILPSRFTVPFSSSSDHA